MPQRCRYQTGVFIGRFQPYHLGHAQMLARALELVQVCIVVIGSAHQAASPKNPWSWMVRAEMIRRSLTPEHVRRVVFLPLRDYYNGDRWARALQTGVAQVLAESGIRTDAGSIALISHYKDASSAYLRWFPQWQTLAFARQNSIDATPLRDHFFAALDSGMSPGNALANLRKQVPASTLDVLQQWASGHEPSELAAEWRAIRDYQASWAQAPGWPPILVTVDNVIECAGRMLVIERERRPGKGYLALPGGLLNPHETIQATAVRGLREATGWALDDNTARAALADVQVFDHPDRDPRGRVITHAHYFQLPYKTLPQVAGHDSARSARWLNRENVAIEEARFFSDHFHILDRMCGVLPDGDA